MDTSAMRLPVRAPQDMSPEETAAKRKPLVALAKEVFADYFRIVRQVGVGASGWGS